MKQQSRWVEFGRTNCRSPCCVKIPPDAGYQVVFAERIRCEACDTIAAVGMSTQPVLAKQILCSGPADVVLLASKFLHDPCWRPHAAQALRVKPLSVPLL